MFFYAKLEAIEETSDLKIVNNDEDHHSGSAIQAERRSSLQLIMDVDIRTSAILQTTELERQINISMWKAYFNCTIPPLINQVSSGVLLFINGFIVARYLGTVGLSCQTYSAFTDYLIKFSSQAFSSGAIAVLSGLIGSGADRETRDLVPSALFWGCILISIVCMLIMYLILDPVYNTIGGTGDILSGALSYSKAHIYVLPCYTFFYTYSSTLLAEGLSRVNMIISLLSTALSCLFTFLFIGYTSMGIDGAAYGDGLALGIGAVLCFSLYFTKYTTVKIKPLLVLKYKKESLFIIWKVLLVGLGSAIIYFAYAFILFLFNYLINDALKDSGTIDLALAASGGISRLYTIFTAVFLSFGSLGFLPLASYYVGKKNAAKLTELSNKVTILISVVTGVMTILLLSLQKQVGWIFSRDPIFEQYFKTAVFWSYSTAMLAAFQFVTISYGQCLGLSNRVMAISISCLCLYQPIGINSCNMIRYGYMLLRQGWI